MGLCARFVLGVGCVGSLLRLALFDVFLGGVGCWIVGIWGGGVCFVGVCFRFGNELFGAAYHLHEVSNRVKVGSSWQWWVVDLLSYFVIFFETLVE